MTDPTIPSANGLCDSCAHQKLVPNTRGSVFSLCLRSRTDARFPRYPRVPVAACPGYERREKDFGGRVDFSDARSS
ncbi:hypothetical protein D3C83_201640 [compost metagenome]